MLNVRKRRCGVEYHAGLTAERFNLVENAERVAVNGFGVGADIARACLCERFNKIVGVGHH